MENFSARETRRLADVVALTPDKILNPAMAHQADISPEAPVLVILAAGKGTRFGQDPKCIQPVYGKPLARHSVDSFRRFSSSPVVVIVGYRAEEVSRALGDDNIYIRSANPTGGTAFASFEAFTLAELARKNPLLIITMGDRIVPTSIFRNLWAVHSSGAREADLTFLTAIYEPPKNRGKGRVLRDKEQRVTRIVEERDILAESDTSLRQARLDLTEGNCPLYLIRANTLKHYLENLTDANAQQQFYLTDIIQAISENGGDIRTVTTRVTDPEYDLLCSDVTQPMDLALLEGVLASTGGLLSPEELEIEDAARAVAAERPAGQVASITRQLEELLAAATREKMLFAPEQPLALGIAGGRLRIAFMHPDMVRFYGPAWQMPIGAGSGAGEEQIVMLVQESDDERIQLFPMNPEYREKVNFIPADTEAMYPSHEISDLHSYEQFGTLMSKKLLLSFGYFSDEELEQRRKRGEPLPPPSLWVSNNMRRPFTLVGNAIASIRTLRSGNLGHRIQSCLGRENFKGLKLVSTGAIPQGGFSSSSAVTVATKNAINALFGLEIPPDLLVHLACQAEYGTGVRAGSLDQATEQKGRSGQGTLISSNPRDNYRIINTYPVPTERFQIIFPYSVERDRQSWRWSWGAYAAIAGAGPLTTEETRKMTGKAAEIAAILTGLPLDTDYFQMIEDDLIADGLLSLESRKTIASILLQIPLLIRQDDLRLQIQAKRGWLLEQFREINRLDAATANLKTDSFLSSLFAGWRDPTLRRTLADGQTVTETGIPLRAMVAYLFAEVAKNFYLIHHPQEWIKYVSLSQRGDCCIDIDPERLPSRAEMEKEQEWEKPFAGPELMEQWLQRHGAGFFDYNRGLDDASLAAEIPPDFRELAGSNFFRGLALIDLAEAMLKRAFGPDAVAVRVNAAGQGDYFQVHLDKEKASPEDLKRFIQVAFYRRFGLKPAADFVELSPGGGAIGVRLRRFDFLPQLIQKLKSL